MLHLSFSYLHRADASSHSCENPFGCARLQQMLEKAGRRLRQEGQQASGERDCANLLALGKGESQTSLSLKPHA
jgi:hypothetical protein